MELKLPHRKNSVKIKLPGRADVVGRPVERGSEWGRAGRAGSGTGWWAAATRSGRATSSRKSGNFREPDSENFDRRKSCVRRVDAHPILRIITFFIYLGLYDEKLGSLVFWRQTFLNIDILITDILTQPLIPFIKFLREISYLFFTYMKSYFILFRSACRNLSVIYCRCTFVFKLSLSFCSYFVSHLSLDSFPG